jgi:hypothetical protein
VQNFHAFERAGMLAALPSRDLVAETAETLPQVCSKNAILFLLFLLIYF